MANCIEDLVKASKGAITKKEAQEIVNSIERRYKQKLPNRPLKPAEQYGADGSKSPEKLLVEAAEEAFKAKVEEKQLAAKRREMQIEAANKLQYQVVKKTVDGRYNKGLGNIIINQVDSRVAAIKETYMAEMYRALEPYLSATGFKKLTPDQEFELATIMMDDARLKSLDGKGGDISEAEYLALQYFRASNQAMLRANEAGADIKALSGRVPQSWDGRLVRYFGMSPREYAQLLMPGTSKAQHARAGSKAMNAWVEFVTPLVDSERYRHPETGEQLTPDEMREVLESVWKTMATGGLAKEVDGLVEGRGASLADKLGAHRELHFKDPQSFLQANRSFGNGDIFQTMINDLNRKAQSTALMEVFGPNPETGFKTIDAYAKSQQAQALNEGTNDSAKNSAMFDELMGRAGMAQEDRHDLINRAMQGTRNYIAAGKMGMLLLAQMNDAATYITMARTDGLDTGRAMRLMFQYLDPRSKIDREIARKHAILAQTVVNDVALRYGAEKVQSMSRELANWTIKLSGAEWWTNSLKFASQTLIASHVADYRHLAIDQLEPAFRRMLDRYGIEARDWDIIRQAEIVKLQGLDIVSPYSVKRVVTRESANMESGRAAVAESKAATLAIREAATRYGMMLTGEADTMVMTPGIETQAFIHQKTQPGTMLGELSRSLWLFKSFSVGIYHKIIPRLLEDGVGYSRGSVAAQWAIGMTVGGALSMQLKEMAKGRDPRDMATPEFWAAAMLQGGGLGIMGDFAFSNVNQFGGSLASSVGGPVVGLADDFRKLTVGNVQQAMAGEDTHAAAETIQFAKNYAPLMNLWYTRLALDHLLFYHIQEAANPGYLRRMRRKAEKEGQSWWFAPDSNRPGLPDLSTMFGGKR